MVDTVKGTLKDIREYFGKLFEVITYNAEKRFLLETLISFLDSRNDSNYFISQEKVASKAINTLLKTGDDEICKAVLENFPFIFSFIPALSDEEAKKLKKEWNRLLEEAKDTLAKFLLDPVREEQVNARACVEDVGYDSYSNVENFVIKDFENDEIEEIDFNGYIKSFFVCKGYEVLIVSIGSPLLFVKGKKSVNVNISRYNFDEKLIRVSVNFIKNHSEG